MFAFSSTQTSYYIFDASRHPPPNHSNPPLELDQIGDQVAGSNPAQAACSFSQVIGQSTEHSVLFNT
jgi:hypothetical protein